MLRSAVIDVVIAATALICEHTVGRGNGGKGEGVIFDFNLMFAFFFFFFTDYR